ncbi:MAG: choice-of-anchor J domain-containing protein [Saprospiraceae bacterium]|nr:choice-of-anchor J domain-containing protein [Saprospiraceae bacterium]
MMFSNHKNWLAPVLFTALFGLFVGACVKQDFDEPPVGGNVVNITPNITIKALKALHITPEGFDYIPDSLVVGGVVVMDDRSGNYYKTLVIQDETGGIEVKFNDGYLYNQFPVGRQVYINVKGLYLTDYAGLTQIVGSLVEENGQLSGIGLTEAQVRTVVQKGTLGNAPAPKVVSISDFNDDLLSTLIRLEDVEFTKADTGKTYADPVTKSSLNRTLEDCNGLLTIIRTSGYADFAGSLTPGKKGTVTGVLGVYNGDYQLYIRDVTDVQMDSLRCGAIDPNGPGLATLDEKFDGTSNNTDIDLAGWQNIAVQGTRYWRGASFSGNKFASATAFGTTNPDPTNETWLISPPLDLKTQKTLTFTSSSGYYRHDGLTVLVSTNFNGSNFATATWTELSFAKPAPNANGYTDFVPSGNITLPVFNGKGFIAFKYVGDKTTNTTTWRFDDVKVQ